LPSDVLALAAFGFLIAAAAKSAQVPFHIWLPGAMEAPTPVSALIHAATMVNAGVYLLARFFPAFSAVPGWTSAVALIGLASAFLGALMALTSTDLKRALAYSTISQLGFMVYAVGIGAIFASQFHLLSHAVFKALLFLGAGAVIHATGTRDLRQLGGLRHRMPFTHLAFLIGALGLIGIPVFNGFWSKELILDQSMREGPAWASWLLLIIIGLTALYTVRIVSLVFYGSPRHERQPHDAPRAMRLVLATLSVGTLTTWLLAVPYAALLAATLPYHQFDLDSDVLGDVIHSPATWISLAVVGVACLLWVGRKRIASWGWDFEAVRGITTADFGFERMARLVADITQRGAERLRAVQTGQVNWNIAQILVFLIVVLAGLAIGQLP
jgi:NADH-quinone oxidoreductase subunit L